MAPEFAVIAALGGVPPSHALRPVRNVTRRKLRHSNMPPRVLLSVLSALGFDAGPGGDGSVQPIPLDWLVKHHRYLFDGAPVIVHLTSQAMVMEKGCFVDHTHLVPTPISDASKAWRVTVFQWLQRSWEPLLEVGC